MTTPSKLPVRTRAADSPYFVIAFKGTAAPQRHYHNDPIVALVAGVDYLRSGYQVRLSDGCVEWFGHHPVPMPTPNGDSTA
jgi:hypothetical protein